MLKILWGVGFMLNTLITLKTKQVTEKQESHIAVNLFLLCEKGCMLQRKDLQKGLRMRGSKSHFCLLLVLNHLKTNFIFLTFYFLSL